jgi:hypothetical protein
LNTNAKDNRLLVLTDATQTTVLAAARQSIKGDPMPDSRRKFLKAGLLAALFAAVPLKNVRGQKWTDQSDNPGAGSQDPNDPLANYTKATFVSYLNSIFQLHTVSGIVAVTLLKVDDMAPPKGGECFSLLFRGGSRGFGQDTYTIDHAALGTFKLLLVPVGTDDNGAQGYLATINRLTYVEALAPAPKGKPAKRTWMENSTTPTNATPHITSPTQSPSPATITPKEPPKPVKKKRKPSWKMNDNEDFDGGLN